MIFKSTPDAVEYLNNLLDSGIEVTLNQLNKILENSSIEVQRTILVEGPVHKLFLEDIIEMQDNKVEVTLLSPSWIRSLPSAYHDNEFLQNFLFGIQASSLSHDTVINNIEKQFDPSSTEFVDWLGSWAGIRFSSYVDDRSKRRILNNIVRLYKIRGTKAYFIDLIEYLIGVKVNITDTDGMMPLHSSLQSRRNFKRGPFFKVSIEERVSDNAEEEKKMIQMIHQVLETEKPIGVNFRVDYPFEYEESLDTQEKVIDMHYENSYDYDILRD